MPAGAVYDAAMLALLLLTVKLLPAKDAALLPLLPAPGEPDLPLLNDRLRATLREKALRVSLNLPDRLPTATVSSASGTSLSSLIWRRLSRSRRHAASCCCCWRAVCCW